jgi:MoxR-like ATPase
MQGLAYEIATRIKKNISQVLVGKEDVLELVLVALGCEGHVLIEDVPGVGKTMLARALALSMDLSFSRIQCTPDLLPTDITGVSVFDQRQAEFRFRPGPIISNLLLVDEINRATPRTQSGLLEAMGEKQVTVDGKTIMLEKPFLVLATENPIEFEGTFPLPEAQLDRFLMRLKMGYPSPAQEIEILSRLETEHPINRINAVVNRKEVLEFINNKKSIFMEESLRTYLVQIIHKTRTHNDLSLGASPRGSIALFDAARVLAAIRGRNFVIPEDIKYLAPFILAHRISVTPEAAIRGIDGDYVIREILQNTPVPTEEALKESPV